jgi:hypothetical protein
VRIFILRLAGASDVARIFKDACLSQGTSGTSVFTAYAIVNWPAIVLRHGSKPMPCALTWGSTHDFLPFLFGSPIRLGWNHESRRNRCAISGSLPVLIANHVDIDRTRKCLLQHGAKIKKWWLLVVRISLTRPPWRLSGKRGQGFY